MTLTLHDQGPKLDVAWLEHDRKLLVRAAEMVYEIREGDEVLERVDRAFGYRVDPAAILPIKAPARNWPHFEEWLDADEPGPPIFTPA